MNTITKAIMSQQELMIKEKDNGSYSFTNYRLRYLENHE